MLPSIYAAITLCEFEHQERIKEAARDRLAATAQHAGPSPFSRMKTARHGAASWLSGWTRRLMTTSGQGAAQGSWALLFTGLRSHRDQPSQS